MDLLHISKVIKSARLQQKLTMAELARKTNLSKTLISRLENFRITPSLNVLNKITGALGIDMIDLFQSEASSPAYLFGNIKKGENIIRNNSNKYGIKYFMLAYKKLDRKLDPFIVEYRPSKNKRGFLTHEMEEFFVLLEGKVEFFVGDEEHCQTMKEGDTVYLSNGVPHAVQLSPGCKKAKALVTYRA